MAYRLFSFLEVGVPLFIRHVPCGARLYVFMYLFEFEFEGRVPFLTEGTGFDIEWTNK